MMKVYMVMDGVEYEGESVVKVFASQADAEQYKEELVAEECKLWGKESEEELMDDFGQYYVVREMEVH